MKNKHLIVILLVFILTACSSVVVKENVKQDINAEEQNINNQNVMTQVDESYTWNLSELYKDKNDLFNKLDGLTKNEIPKFIDLVGKFKKPSELYGIILLKNKINEELSRMATYAYFRQSINVKDNEYNDIQTKVQNASEEYGLANTKLINILLSKDDKFINELKNDSLLMKIYGRELSNLLESKEYVLSDREEELLIPAGKSINNTSNLYNILLYSELPHSTVVTPEGETIDTSDTNYGYAMSNKDRNFRKEFMTKRFNDYKKFEFTFTQNMNNFINLVEDLAKKHNYKNCLEESLGNEYLDEDFYTALISGARDNAKIRTRYYEILKKQLNVDELWQYDLFVNITDTFNPTFSYEEGKKILLDVLSIYGDDYKKVLNEAFNNRWIDVYPKEGKDTGAYSMPMINYHPFVLMNYQDDYHSLSTLFHELGHMVNHYWSDKSQEAHYEKSICTGVTEVASTANEIIFNTYMKNNAKTKEEKLYYLGEEWRLLNNTFFTQALLSDFEREMHRLVEEGESLSPEKLSEIYKKLYSIYCPTIKQLDNNGIYWASVPHFYSSYYVYDYALAISVACNVVDKIEKGEAGYIDKYLKFLTLGDTMDTTDIFKTIDVDITNPHFVDALANRCNGIIDEMESLLK